MVHPVPAEPGGGRRAGSPCDCQVADWLKTYLRLRRARGRFLNGDLFADPAWDILLDLFVARAEGRLISTSSACIGACVASTTGLRWLRTLEAEGLVQRVADQLDRRQRFISLTPSAIAAVRGWALEAMTELHG